MILGRSHVDVPSVWYRPVWDYGVVTEGIPQGSVIDVSSQPALWGHRFRDAHTRFLARSPIDIGASMNDRHAYERIEAHLIETLSSVGRGTIDFYALRIRGRMPEANFAGAIEAIEVARQDGMVGVYGLCVEGPSQVALAHWQFNDAFDFLICPARLQATLAPTADSRRAGMIVEEGEDTSVVRLVTIRLGDPS